MLIIAERDDFQYNCSDCDFTKLQACEEKSLLTYSDGLQSSVQQQVSEQYVLSKNRILWVQQGEKNCNKTEK